MRGSKRGKVGERKEGAKKETDKMSIFAIHPSSLFSARNILIHPHSQMHIHKTLYAYILLFYKMEHYILHFS